MALSIYSAKEASTYKKKKHYGREYDSDVSHYIGVKTKRYVKKFNLALPDAYYFAVSKAMKKRAKQFHGSLETLMPYMLVSPHVNRKQCLRKHNLGKFYFDPVLNVHFCLHDQDGQEVVHADGSPFLVVQDETHSFLNLRVEGHTCIPSCGEWSITVSMTDKHTGETVRRELTGVYDIGFLAFQHAGESTMDMFVDLHDGSQGHVYHAHAIPLARAVVKLVRSEGDAFYPVALELYCDYGEPHQHHVHHHRCMRHLHHVHARHQRHHHHRGHVFGVLGAAHIGAEAGQEESATGSAPPAALTLELLKEKLRSVMSKYIEAPQAGGRTEFALLDGTPAKPVLENLQLPDSGKGSQEVTMAYYDAHTITHVILTAGLLQRLYRIDGYVEGTEPRQLHDPEFLVTWLGKDSDITKALRRIYVHHGMPTLAHLLLHTAGLPEMLPVSAKRLVSDVTSERITHPTESEYATMLSEAADVGLEAKWAPGSAHDHSFVGMVIAGIVLSNLARAPLKDVIVEDARRIFGMTQCAYIRYESEVEANRVVRSYAAVLPGDPGVEAANRGLMVTASDVAAFANTFVATPMAPEVSILTKPIVQISKTLPGFACYGGGVVDDQSVRTARTVKFHSYVEQGHTISVFVYPEYGVAFSYATNVIPALVGTGYKARLHAQVLRAIVDSGRYPKLAVMNRSAETKEPAVDLPSGYNAMVAEMAERLGNEENKKRILEEVNRFLALVDKRVFSALITDASGNVETVEFFKDDKHPVMATMVPNGAHEHAVRISPDVCPDGKLLWKLVNPEGLLTEPVFLWELDSPVPGMAVTVYGQVYFEESLLNALLAAVKKHMADQMKSVDTTKLEIDSKYRAEVLRIGAPGWAWPFLGGLALGGVAAAAAYYPWYRRPAYYAPMYAYPYPVRRYPRWYYYPYIRGNVNETEKLEIANSGKTAEYTQTLKEGPETDEAIMASNIGAGRHGGGGGGGGGGARVSSYRPSVRFSGGYIPNRGVRYQRGWGTYGVPWTRSRAYPRYYGGYPWWASYPVYLPSAYPYVNSWTSVDPYYDTDPYATTYV